MGLTRYPATALLGGSFCLSHCVCGKFKMDGGIVQDYQKRDMTAKQHLNGVLPADRWWSDIVCWLGRVCGQYAYYPHFSMLTLYGFK